MKASIFIGPSIELAEAKRLLPGAHFHGPAAQGDLLSAFDLDRPDIIGLIDGTFHQNLSVWHNEVLYLLSLGVSVFGASSMGALRAVETERFGTVGIGTIYRWYRDGVIVGDDEVALLHGEVDVGYRALSVPQVNVRASLERGVSEGRLEVDILDRVLAISKSIHYPERSVPTLLERCGSAEIPSSHLAAVQLALTTHYVDVKREDARELLTAISDVIEGRAERPKKVEFEFIRSSVFDNLYNLDRKVLMEEGAVTLQRVAEHYALYCTDFWKTRTAAIDRSIVLAFGMLLNLTVTEEEAVAERDLFLAARGLRSPDKILDWLHRNAFSEADLGEYVMQEVICRKLRRWALTARSMDRGCKRLLDELRAQGVFEHWAKDAVQHDSVVAAYVDQPEYEFAKTENPAVLADRHARHGGVEVRGDARLWAEDAGFYDVDALAAAIRRATVYDEVRERISRSVSALDGEGASLLDDLVRGQLDASTMQAPSVSGNS